MVVHAHAQFVQRGGVCQAVRFFDFDVVAGVAVENAS
jgi:hypothetical protein